MSEEKCDHIIGYSWDNRFLYRVHETEIKYWPSSAMKIKHKFCPLCGVEIEGDLTSGG
jgi:hypothetical protein